MKILSLATLPLDFPGGSQLLIREQAAALSAAGAEVTTFSHASCDGGIEASFEQVEVAKAVSPRRYRPGITSSRMVTNMVQASLLARLINRRRPDVILAQHVEAALFSRPTAALFDVPVVYVAHTSLADELPDFYPALPQTLCRRLGQAVDRFVARRVDGVIALSPSGKRLFSRICRSPVIQILPGFDLPAPPDEAFSEEIARRHGLSPRRYVVYAGGLARFQNTDFLARLASRLDVPVLIVTHDAPSIHPAGVRIIRTGSFEESRLILWSGAVGLVPRKQSAGFPMKVLSYLEAGLPVVAAQGALDGYIDGELIIGADASQSVEPFAAAVRHLLATGGEYRRRVVGCRALMRRLHDCGRQATETLSFLGHVIDHRPAVSARLPAFTPR